jgi:hypothetical protein
MVQHDLITYNVLMKRLHIIVLTVSSYRLKAPSQAGPRVREQS